MIHLISRNQRAAPRVIQPSMITNLSHDCHLDLCIGNTNEQSHLEYLNLQYLGWNSHLAMFVQIGDCIMHLGGREICNCIIGIII